MNETLNEWAAHTEIKRQTNMLIVHGRTSDLWTIHDLFH